MDIASYLDISDKVLQCLYTLKLELPITSLVQESGLSCRPAASDLGRSGRVVLATAPANDPAINVAQSPFLPVM